MALRKVLGTRPVRTLRLAGKLILEAVLFQQACNELIDCIMEAWGQLANRAMCYPGLMESSETTCVWRDRPSAFRPLVNAMLVKAGVQQNEEWESWRHLVGPPEPLAKTFLDAWRALNPETPVVARITSLLEHGTYEVRIYPYDEVYDRAPILLLTWVERCLLCRGCRGCQARCFVNGRAVAMGGQAKGFSSNKGHEHGHGKNSVVDIFAAGSQKYRWPVERLKLLRMPRGKRPRKKRLQVFMPAVQMKCLASLFTDTLVCLNEKRA